MSWYALQTAPQRERALVGRRNEDGVWQPGELEKLGHTVFLPVEIIETRRMNPDRTRSRRVVPMLPGYVFIEAVDAALRSNAPPWTAALAHDDVVTYVGFDKDLFGSRIPALIRDHEMTLLRGMSGKIVKDKRDSKKVALGGKAKIITPGHMWEGRVVDVIGLRGAKAKIFLGLFGVDCSEIQIKALEAA